MNQKVFKGELMKKLLVALLALGTISAFASVDDCTVKVPMNTQAKVINALVKAGLRPEVDNAGNDAVSCDMSETQFCLSFTYDQGPLQPRIGFDVLDTVLFLGTFGFSPELIHEPYVSWKREIKLGINLHEARDRKLGPIRASVVSNKKLKLKSKFDGSNPEAKNHDKVISIIASEIESQWDCRDGEFSLL